MLINLYNYNYIINFQKTEIETNIMSDIVEQIDKLKDKAHKLKEGVSNIRTTFLI